MLAVEAPADRIEPFAWVEEEKRYREFLVPADVLNECARISLAEHLPSLNEVDQAMAVLGGESVGSFYCRAWGLVCEFAFAEPKPPCPGCKVADWEYVKT